jgi:hypothetical protein
LIILIIEKNGKVLAATDAAARFIKPGAQRGSDVRGMSLKETPYPELTARETSEVQRSWATGEPSQAIDWLLSANGDYRPYSVSRIGFPEGRWMIIMMPVPLTEQWMQLEDIKDVISANNLRQPITVTVKQFEALIDLDAGLTVEKAAERRGVTLDAINKSRSRLKTRLSVSSTKDILAAIAHTELGYLVKLWSHRVVDVDDE